MFASDVRRPDTQRGPGPGRENYGLDRGPYLAATGTATLARLILLAAFGPPHPSQLDRHRRPLIMFVYGHEVPHLSARQICTFRLCEHFCAFGPRRSGDQSGARRAIGCLTGIMALFNAYVRIIRLVGLHPKLGEPIRVVSRCRASASLRHVATTSLAACRSSYDLLRDTFVLIIAQFMWSWPDGCGW